MMNQLETATVPWVLELHAPYLLDPIKVFVKERVIVGRHVPGQAEPDVDLGASATNDHPVARHHLALYSDGGDLMVMDLNSDSGTSLNGQALLPNEGYPLVHGDQLRLGRLSLEVQVILSPTSGGAMHYEPGLNLHDQTAPRDDQWVLIVEHDSEIAQVLCEVMRQAGFITKTAHDVVSAIRAFSQAQPNAIILDLNLPDMDGLEFCRYVRRDVLHNTVPILAVSRSNEAKAALQAGADLVMDKPLNGSDLRDVMVALVNQHENSIHAITTRRLTFETPFNVFPPDTRRQGTIIFVTGFENDPIILNSQKSTSFGRKPGSGSIGSQTHIDLTRYDAANCGVSRVHMFLHHHDGDIFIEDVDSRNHTYINGVAITPFERVLLQNGDEIRLGHLRMYMYFFEDDTAQ
jgi:CheY-like chemotaxis protein/pSer/pThr/pTyr-binding forkhead associated (FHA) protein